MKFTLAFDIFNKAAIIESVVRSWLDNLSGKHEIEVVAVFDALTDASDRIVADVTADYSLAAYKALYTADVFEIKANNAALDSATGDVIIFIQDDNWMFDRGWDDTLAQVWLHFAPIGTVSLLSGVRMHQDFNLDRIECFRPHKDERAWVHGINKDAYPLGVYQVDAINRPFSTSVDRLRTYGGLDEAYCPMDYDDADLSFKLLRDGCINLYAPFDLLNICAKKETLTQSTIAENYQRGERVARERWAWFIADRESSVRLLAPMEVTDAGLSFR